MSVPVVISDSIGAGEHAGFAANTTFSINYYGPILCIIGCARGADLDTGSFLAMQASSGEEIALHLRELPHLPVFHPVEEDPWWRIICGLAGQCASMTANTTL
jgi:hypothetical protein